jgi:hypothetical protein
VGSAAELTSRESQSKSNLSFCRKEIEFYRLARADYSCKTRVFGVYSFLLRRQIGWQQVIMLTRVEGDSYRGTRQGGSESTPVVDLPPDRTAQDWTQMPAPTWNKFSKPAFKN